MGKIKTIFKDDLGAVNRCLRSYSSVYMVYDSNVAALTGEISKHVRASLPITVSERMKTVEEAVKIDRWLLEQNADRKALVLAVGGGVTIDLAGFAASIYKKGIAWACVPTSLLAQVNAAVTGRTGVNLGAEKDILGSLQKPTSHSSAQRPWRPSLRGTTKPAWPNCSRPSSSATMPPTR